MMKLKRFRAVAGILVLLVLVAVVGGTLAFSITSTDLNPAGAGDDPIFIVTRIAPSYPPRVKVEHGIEGGVDNVGWTTVTMSNSYTSPVVIATPSYSSSEPPLVTRIQNASGSSFDVRVQRADGSTTGISGVDVHWFVVESGTYTVAANGYHMEAGTFVSTITDDNGSWLGQVQAAPSSFTSPVVFGQVMTYADTDWSVFWARGSGRNQPPSASNLWIGKHVGEHADNTRANETLGYIILESGSGSFGGISYEATLGGDTVRGWDDSPPYSYTHSLSTASTVVLSSAAMDVTNGAWPVLHEPSPISSTDFDLVIQEDQEADVELSHQTEQVAFLVLD
jgi:hypothetical protein